MNTYIFTSPRYQPLNDDGERMPNAYLQFFESDTDTPTPVYSDASLSTSLGSEVEADANGVFQVMYMDPEVTYRVKLFDADDTLQYDVDPYTPPRDYPTGTVMWFYGDATARDAAYPPALWQILDGNNGAPDGRDRFPIIAGGDHEAGDTGGAAITATETGGAHDHGEATGETVLTEAMGPLHTHRLFVRMSSTQRGNTRGFGFAGTAGLEGQIIDDAPYDYLDNSPSEGDPLVEAAGEAEPEGHSHTITEDEGHTHTIAGGGVPPFIALWALMRRAV